MKRILTVLILLTIAAGMAWAGGEQEKMEATAATEAPKKVEFWTYGGARVEEPMTAIIGKFETLNTEIDVEMLMFPDWADLHQKLLMSIASGDAPDTATAKPLLVADLIARGTLYPMDDLAQKHNVDLGDYADVLVDAGYYQGKHYILPVMISCPVLYYNTAMFEDNGLSKTPDTWAEMVDVAKKLTQPDKKQWGYFAYGGRNDFLMANWQNGGELLTPDNSAPAFNTPAAVEAVQWIVDLEHKHNVMPPLSEQDTNIIYQNRVGMWYQAMSRLGRYKRDAPDLTFATAILPKKVNRTTIEMGNGAILMKDGNNQDGAFRFLEYLCTDSWAQQLYSQETGYASAAKEVLNSEFYSGNPILAPFQWQILNDIKSRPVIPNSGEMLDIIEEEMEQALYLKKSPQQMLDDMEGRIKDVLSSF